MVKTIERTYSTKVRWILLLFQLSLLYVPSFQFFSIPTDNGSIPASLCYFFSLVFAPYLLIRLPRLRLPHWSVLGLFALVYSIALIRWPQYGLSKSILHWAFGLYLIVTVLNLGTDFTKEQWLKLLEAGACIFALLHFLHMLSSHELVLELLNEYCSGTISSDQMRVNCSAITSLTRGGRNLDATWLALGGFFVRGKKKAVYGTYALVFAFFGASRVGIIASFFLVLWTLVYDPIFRLTLKNIKWYVLYGLCVLVLLVGTGMMRVAVESIVPESMMPWKQEEIAEVTSSQPEEPQIIDGYLSGRGAMWERFPQMLADNPFGYGVGNAVRVMRQDYGFTSYEDVMHNVLLQITLDEGVVGGLWFLSLCGAFFYSQRKERFKSPYAAFLLTYIVLSIVQFHGGEALMQFTLAAFLVERNAWFLAPWAPKANYESGETKNGTPKSIADYS